MEEEAAPAPAVFFFLLARKAETVGAVGLVGLGSESRLELSWRTGAPRGGGGAGILLLEAAEVASSCSSSSSIMSLQRLVE